MAAARLGLHAVTTYFYLICLEAQLWFTYHIPLTIVNQRDIGKPVFCLMVDTFECRPNEKATTIDNNSSTASSMSRLFLPVHVIEPLHEFSVIPEVQRCIQSTKVHASEVSDTSVAKIV